MIIPAFRWPALLAGFSLGLLLQGPAFAGAAEARLGAAVQNVEQDLGARVGVVVRDSGSGWQWAHRADERFLMTSSFKSVLCGAVLGRVDAGALSLAEPLAIEAADLLDYAPVTERHVDAAMSVGDLCLATLDMSDNTAANLLIDRLGGPQQVTAFLRGIGDEVTRLDRREPEVNSFAAGDPRDTTSPSAMLASWQAMLLGDALSPASRAQLTEWMSHGGVTGGLLRASLPAGWAVADKSGNGGGTRSLVAMVTPPTDAPYLVAIYVSDTDADFAARNAAVIAIGAAVAEVLQAR